MRPGPAQAPDFTNRPSLQDKKILDGRAPRNLPPGQSGPYGGPALAPRLQALEPERSYQVVLDAFTKRVVRAVALYWCENPFACDTAEGIRHWWLPADEAVSTEQVNRALAWLCDRALVERLLPADGRERFRRAGGADAALRLLAQSGDPGEVRPRQMR